MKNAKGRVALELFFMYGPSNDNERNLEHMKRMHLYTKESDAYSVGFLVKMIWRGKDCKEFFKDTIGLISFSVKLDALIHEDPRKMPSLARVVEDLMGPPYNFKVRDCRFRYTI
jgi:hypothetical protein